jgi:hypothetical protein
VDRIARIIKLEGAVAKPERIASAVRWETAKLYWEEVQAGTQQKDIAARVGKGKPHVHYMVRCWIYVIESGLETQDLSSLPDFQGLYRSDVIRMAGEARERNGKLTEYNGILMRSKLEADYAAALDRIGADWEYEPRYFGEKGNRWLVDFLVNGVWTELKPAGSFGPAAISAQLRRIAVVWEEDPDATVRLTLWQYRNGPVLVITGYAGRWVTTIPGAPSYYPDNVHGAVAEMIDLLPYVLTALPALSEDEHKVLRHAMRTIERALAAGRPRRAA